MRMDFELVSGLKTTNKPNKLPQ